MITAEKYALNLAKSLHAKHYAHVTEWKPREGDLLGLMAQIDNMTAALSASPAVVVKRDLYHPDELMADGGEVRMTAAEEVLAYLLIEVIGVPDDEAYSPNRAQLVIEDKLRSSIAATEARTMGDELKPVARMNRYKYGQHEQANVYALKEAVDLPNGSYPLYPASAITALREENERLKRVAFQAQEMAKEQSSRATVAEAKLAEAMKVIEPFAEVAFFILQCAQKDASYWYATANPTGDDGAQISIDYLRAAHAFIEKEKSNG